MNCRKNIPTGIARRWYANGVLDAETEIKNGKIIWRRCYDPKGKIMECTDTKEQEEAIAEMAREAKVATKSYSGEIFWKK
jgi:antitoxin component YwqK of YwqJK toxin-antitoxin module